MLGPREGDVRVLANYFRLNRSSHFSLVFPRDKVTLQIPTDKGKHQRKLFKKRGNDEPQFDECQIDYDAITKELWKRGHVVSPAAISMIKGSFTVLLEVAEGNIERVGNS